jgi:hypothetical protein
VSSQPAPAMSGQRSICPRVSVDSVRLVNILTTPGLSELLRLFLNEFSEGREILLVCKAVCQLPRLPQRLGFRGVHCNTFRFDQTTSDPSDDEQFSGPDDLCVMKTANGCWLLLVLDSTFRRIQVYRAGDGSFEYSLDLFSLTELFFQEPSTSIESIAANTSNEFFVLISTGWIMKFQLIQTEGNFLRVIFLHGHQISDAGLVRGLAIGSDGLFVCICHYSQNQVCMYTQRELHRRACLLVNQPCAAVMSKDASEVYVAGWNEGDITVTVFSTTVSEFSLLLPSLRSWRISSEASGRRVPSPGFLLGRTSITLSKDGEIIVTAILFGSKIHVFDTHGEFQRLAEIPRIPLLDGDSSNTPQIVAMASLPSGRMILADQANCVIAFFR